MDGKAILRGLFDAAVAAADPMLVVPEALGRRPRRVMVVGAGKASARMAEALEHAWGPCAGLVITRYGHGRPTRGIEIVEAAHPVPDAAGVQATRRMLEIVSRLEAGDTLVALDLGGWLGAALRAGRRADARGQAGGGTGAACLRGADRRHQRRAQAALGG